MNRWEEDSLQRTMWQEEVTVCDLDTKQPINTQAIYTCTSLGHCRAGFGALP